jgi:hypothetical protein
MSRRYDAKFGAMTKSEQEHAGQIDAGQTPAVQYGYELTTMESRDTDDDQVADEFVMNFRADSVTYPNAREMRGSREWRL